MAKADEGLPSWEEGGCAYLAAFTATPVLALVFNERSEGCTGFLEYIFSSIVGGVFIAGILMVIANIAFHIFNDYRARQMAPREREIDLFLQDSPNGLRDEEKRYKNAISRIDKHLQETKRSVGDLSSIGAPDEETLKARKAFLGKALERLVEKQSFEMQLLYIQCLRWWNSLKPLGEIGALPNRRAELDKALSIVGRCQSSGAEVIRIWKDRVWPGNMEQTEPIVNRGLELCGQVSEAVRRRRSNIDLKAEADGRYQFPGLANLQADEALPLRKPTGRPQIPAVVRDSISLSGQGLETENRALWENQSVGKNRSWVKDVLDLVDIRN